MLSTRDFSQKQILFVLLEEGEKVSFKNDNIVIKKVDDSIKHQSTCYRLFALFIAGHVCVTSGLLERARKFGFVIVFLTYSMRVSAILPSRAEGNVLLRRKQYEYIDFSIGAHIAGNKIMNQAALIQKKRGKTDEEKKTIALLQVQEKSILVPDLSLTEIMGLEGISAKMYFETIFAGYNWTARRPRVKHDALNCLMDIGYTMLFNIINGLLELFGFDTYVGVLHRQFFHRKSLVCDIMEPFRPIIDSVLVKALHLGQIHEKDFSIENKQYFIYGKKAVPYITLMLQEVLKYKDEIFLYVQQYYRAFMRQKAAEEFPVYVIGEKNASCKL